MVRHKKAGRNHQSDDNDDALFPDDSHDEFNQRAESHKYIEKLEQRVKRVRERQSRQAITAEEKKKVDNFTGNEFLREDEEMLGNVQPMNDFLIDEDEEQEQEQEQGTGELEMPNKGVTKRFYDVETGELDEKAIQWNQSKHKSWLRSLFWCL